VRKIDVYGDRFPMVVFEGDLASDRAVTLIPSIWEWDGGQDMFKNLIATGLVGIVLHHQMRDVNGERLLVVKGITAGVNIGDMTGKRQRQTAPVLGLWAAVQVQ
jgi:hypothetical protein